MTPKAGLRITVGLPSELLEDLDDTARRLHRSRAEVTRQAIERYLDDFDDLTVAVERLRDRSDPVLDWDHVRGCVLRSE